MLHRASCQDAPPINGQFLALSAARVHEEIPCVSQDIWTKFPLLRKTSFVSLMVVILTALIQYPTEFYGVHFIPISVLATIGGGVCWVQLQRCTGSSLRALAGISCWNFMQAVLPA